MKLVMTTAKSEKYELPALGYEYGDLEPACSAEILELHHSKHHKGYVDGANKTRASLAEARKNSNFDKINQLQKNLAFNLSGHVLHSLFWQNMSPGGASKPHKDLQSEIDSSFGGMDAFREQFLAAGTGVQGSGWAALSWEPLSGSLIVEQIYDHQGNWGSTTLPLLVMDMWEHAFYLQYKNEKKRWAKAFFEIINWEDVGERLARVEDLELITLADQ